jgi:hypothetical protein
LRAWGLYPNQPILRRLGKALVILALVQVALGISALAATGTAGQTYPRPAPDVILTTAHQAVGAILLACVVALMLWSYRLLSPGLVQTDEPAGAPAANAVPGEPDAAH